jgi:tetratricopeptide (TPR) repeat protein
VAIDDRKQIGILHLSDLHFKPSDSPNALLGPLREDLRNFRDTELEFVVVSGDLVDKGSTDAFPVAIQFLRELQDVTKVPFERFIICPGNHDIQEVAGLFVLKEKPGPDEDTAEGIRHDAQYVRVLSKYAERFAAYRSTIQEVTGDDRLSRSYFYPNHGIQFVTFNTAHRIDKYRRKDAAIDFNAFSQVIREADAEASTIDKQLFRIAVCHHAVEGQWSMVEPKAFLERLARSGFAVLLHGDVHEPRAQVENPHQEALPIIGAGTMHAPDEARPPATGYFYNLINVKRDLSRIYVNVREQRTKDGVFNGYHQFGPLSDRKDYYTVEKPRIYNEQPAAKVGALTHPDTAISALANPIAAPTVWHIPPPIEHFHGREEYLELLRKAFVSSSQPLALTQAIKGLGGLGKTQTALQYAQIHQAEYAYGLRVVADSPDNIISGFAEFAALVGTPEHGDPDKLKVARAAKRWFESNDKWLLILDNLEDWDTARTWIPSSKRGHVLITTRLQPTGTVAAGFELPKLTPDEGAAFLLARAKLNDPGVGDLSVAAEIAREFDGLPLGLEQAGAYIEETQLSPGEYLDLYKRQGEKLRNRSSEFADHATVTVTFSLAVSKLSESAKQIVQQAAFFAPEAIPEELLAQGDGLDIQFRDAMADAIRSSLIHRNPSTKTIDVHRVVQAVVKDSMDDASKRAWIERSSVALNKHLPKEVTFTNWPACERLLPHALVIAVGILNHYLESVDAASVLSRTGWYLADRARYVEAQPLVWRSLEIREKALGPEHPDTAMSLNNLASIYEEQGQFKDAEPLSKRALAIREKALGPEHPDTAASLNNLASIYQEQGRFKDAEPLWKRALAIREKALGPEHPDTAMSLNNLAYVYQEQGQFKDAEPLSKRALVINEKALGPEHPATAASLNNLAYTYQEQGRFKDAEPLFKRALVIIEKALGPEHPDTAKSLNNLAAVYKEQRQFKDAEPLSKRALAIREKALGPEHPDTAMSLNNLASIYQEQGQFKDAEPLFKRALVIHEKALGPEHPDTATSLNNLASIYQEQGQLKDAEPLLKRALAINEKALGPEHPDTAMSLNNLASIYVTRQRFYEAEPLVGKALRIAERTLGIEHPTAKSVARNYAEILQKLGRGHQAHKVRQRFGIRG